jgi:hypothetical protein
VQATDLKLESQPGNVMGELTSLVRTAAREACKTSLSLATVVFGIQDGLRKPVLCCVSGLSQSQMVSL